jgi:hypothetical protein
MPQTTTQGFPNNVLSDSVGSTPDVSSNLEVENRVIESTDQAFSVCETLVNDWKKGILNSARITAKLNGERPYNQRKLDNNAKGWKTNISTGFLATECRKIVPRLFMPIKSAKYLTAAELPADWPDGAAKTQHFRQTITDAIRSWPKFNFYIRGLCREFGTFGFAFNCWFDEYEPWPSLQRMDRAFVPQGTEIMDEPAFFMVKYDYRPNELLDLLKAAKEAGRDEWNEGNAIDAINSALPPPADATYPNARTYEELIRQATWAYTYTKGAKVIRTYHLFSKETTGKVSHYIMVSDRGAAIGDGDAKSPSKAKGDNRMLYKNEDQFDSMFDVQSTFVFDFGDGTIHGSWGAGQILYDLAAQVEKIRCDSIDNMRLTNKIKAQVTDAKNINDVKLTINDQMVIVSGAQFAGNTAGMPVEIQGYEQLDAKLTQLAQQKIGAFVPPIPTQPSDIKAAQINAALAQEKELQEDMIENCLIQWAPFIHQITKRLCNPNSPSKWSKAVQAKLTTKLNAEEMQMLIESVPAKTVSDFTEAKAQQRAMFAHTVMNNPLFNQNEVARVMAEGAGDETFVKSIVNPAGDQSQSIEAQRQQILETTSLGFGNPVPILPKDNDWVHMQTLSPVLHQMLMNPQSRTAGSQAMLQHYAAHYTQGVAKKGIPDDQINPEKSKIAEMEKLLQHIQQRDQIAAQHQQLLAAQAGGQPQPGQQPQQAAPPPQQQ